jgi:hypothetical protein
MENSEASKSYRDPLFDSSMLLAPYTRFGLRLGPIPYHEKYCHDKVNITEDIKNQKKSNKIPAKPKFSVDSLSQFTNTPANKTMSIKKLQQIDNRFSIIETKPDRKMNGNMAVDRWYSSKNLMEPIMPVAIM